MNASMNVLVIVVKRYKAQVFLHIIRVKTEKHKLI